MTFYARLIRETQTEQQALFGVQQIRDGLTGRISLQTYIAYLTEAYHHVKHTVPLLKAARAGLDSRHHAFMAAFDDYIAEETGHEEWILNDIRNAGGDAEAVRHGQPSAATELMVAFVYDYIHRINPLGMFGMVFVLEGTSVQLATHGAEAVRATLGLKANCFSYLLSHGSLDLSHMAFFEGLMGQVDNPADQDAIIHVARRVFTLFADMFRSIPHLPAPQEVISHAL
ncbi:iron-containing redox enzyme family protein [Asticcacaulis sp. DXS10W]|uniref:Iron-containing redox enzyme family protein n=1 Tax=Asticcacaulis currens TaxID=2984210 RepID=A0ABT5IEF0_9CAUL|nr:iron-containing redox enzyme family protein [Asticcacaulis currens]MDC7694347.1 iron-containing redox enzyme family protein [Asticcacaulis currens]